MTGPISDQVSRLIESKHQFVRLILMSHSYEHALLESQWLWAQLNQTKSRNVARIAA